MDSQTEIQRVADITELQTRLERVHSFAFPLAKTWEDTATVRFESRRHSARFEVDCTIPMAYRESGAYPKGPDGKTFYGVAVQFFSWGELVAFVDWLEGIQKLGMVGMDYSEE